MYNLFCFDSSDTYQASPHNVDTQAGAGPNQRQPSAVGTVLHPHQAPPTLSRQRYFLRGIDDVARQPQQSTQCPAHAEGSGQAAEQQARMGSKRVDILPRQPQAIVMVGGAGRVRVSGGVADPRVKQATVDQWEKVVVEAAHSSVQ